MALQAHLLLDTGPTSDELDDIRAAFREIGMTADAQGHSYGGPPPTSAFLIVVNTQVTAFLDLLAAHGADGGLLLSQLARRLLALRADSRRWGRPHGLRLEDAHSELHVVLGTELPETAYGELLRVDLSWLDQTLPAIAVEWHPLLAQWRARPLIAPVMISRRLPLRERGGGDHPGPRPLCDTDIRALWRLAEDETGSAIRWQRAMVVLKWALGKSTAVIARHVMLGEDDVRRILANFTADGFDSLDPDYAGHQPADLAAAQRAEIIRISECQPRELGVNMTAWSYGALADFLVAEGVIGDVDAGSLRELTTLPEALAG